MELKIKPYKMYSQSAKVLAQALNVKRIRRNDKSKYKHKNDNRIISWGSSEVIPNVPSKDYINHPTKVNKVTNKKTFFDIMTETNNSDIIPKYTTDKEVARSWFFNRLGFPIRNKRVCIRHLLRDNSGKGLVIVSDPKDLVDAPLYVEYIPKSEEYRIHVVKSTLYEEGYGILDVQRKARKLDVENPNWEIRNHENGFVFSRNNIGIVPQCVYDASIRCIDAIDLDFAALDVIYNKKQNRAYVLEANTAPGIEGTTLKKYVNFFVSLTKWGKVT